MRRILVEGGRMLVWKDEAHAADGRRWFLNSGRLRSHLVSDGRDTAFRADLTPTGNGGFYLMYEEAMEEFQLVAE